MKNIIKFDYGYSGFSNDILWPLFHYLPLPTYKAGSEQLFESLWDSYVTANKLFVEAVLTVYNEKTDIIWV